MAISIKIALPRVTLIFLNVICFEIKVSISSIKKHLIHIKYVKTPI